MTSKFNLINLFSTKKRKIIFAAIFLLPILCYFSAKSILYNEYNNNAAVEYLNKHAEATSTNSCAKYVRRAIDAGGCPTFGQPPAACDYTYFLPDLGFTKISTDGYIPQKGDIVVFSAIKGHKSGHIAMYNGKQWVSDFKQRTIYSNSAYRSNGTHSYWRRPDGKKWRKVSLRSWRRAFGIFLGIQ